MTSAAIRQDGWESRLAQTVARAMDSPYAIGQHDCFLFACACAEALTGVDIAAHLAGRYRTRIGAMKLIRVLGGPAKAITELLGVEAQGARLARRGDWLLYRDEVAVICGIGLSQAGIFSKAV